MGIEATSSTVSTMSTTQTSSSSSTSKANSDTSFQEEMSKVTESESKKETKSSEKNEKEVAKNTKTTEKKEETKVSKNNKAESSKNNVVDSQDSADKGFLLNAQLSFNDANTMLANDIQQMIENTTNVSKLNKKSWSFGFGNDSKSNLSITETDADFFINLTQNENINVQAIVAQGQGMLEAGADAAQVKQNVQISQTLLNALQEARQNNQPLRIDFDQNVSVILRIGRDGAISAQFIPGDKAVEQYLRQNIDTLKATFDEKDLPYTELSYSNSSKDQNQRRREQRQQGE